MSCNSKNIRLRSRIFPLVVGLIVFLPTALLRELGAQTPSASSPAAQPLKKWDKYTLKDGEFSVLLPTVPAMSSFMGRMDRSSKNQQRHVIGTYAQGVVYGILIYEVRQSLDEFIAESRRASGNGVTRDVMVSGIRGKEYAFEDDNVRGVTQFFLLGKRLYVFLTQGLTVRKSGSGHPQVL